MTPTLNVITGALYSSAATNTTEADNDHSPVKMKNVLKFFEIYCSTCFNKTKEFLNG
jgi:hypothetical protein